jgi:hypothetical protein
MKPFLLIAVSFFFIKISKGQDVPEKIVQAFSSLKIEMNKKNEIVITMVSQYKKINIADSSDLEQATETASKLTKQLGKYTFFDSSYIQMIGSINEYLNVLIPRIEKKPLIQKIANQEIVTLRIKLEASENRIGILKNNYNNLCHLLHRLDLVLKIAPSLVEDNKIEF